MEATPRTNRSAKGGARSSLHYGGEGVLIHPPHQGVCGRHGTEDLSVTPGGLSGSSDGTEGSDPISASEMGSGVLGVVGRPSSTRSAVNATRPEAWRQSVSGKAAGKGGWGETENEMSKADEVDSSFSERPEHHRPRKLVDWITIQRGRGRFTRSSTKSASGRASRTHALDIRGRQLRISTRAIDKGRPAPEGSSTRLDWKAGGASPPSPLSSEHGFVNLVDDPFQHPPASCVFVKAGCGVIPPV